MLRLGRSCPATLALLVLLQCVVSYQQQASAQKESFSEEIVASPLFDGRVLVHFHFTSTAPHVRHYSVFPQSVGQLVSAVPFDEVELSLTQGRWRYHRWDQPLLLVKPAGAVSVPYALIFVWPGNRCALLPIWQELRALFNPKVPKPSLPPLWSTLSHALGGLFCASLHFVARPETTAVQAITAAAYAANRSSTDDRTDTSSIEWKPEAAGSHVLYAALPQEASCTENLTPWLKLLPCRDAAGIARLLQRREIIFGAEYHSLRVLIKVKRGPKLEPLHSTLTQTLTLVLNPSNSSSRNPGGAGSTTHPTFSNIDLDSLMGTELQSACPVAQHSRVGILLPGQVSGDHLEQLLQLPAYCTTTADTASTRQNNPTADTAEDQVDLGTGTDADRKNPQHVATPSCTVDFGAQSGDSFTLIPAPNAVALLQPSGTYSKSASKTDSQSSCSSSVSSNSSSQYVVYIYDLHAQCAGSNSSMLPFKLSWSSDRTSTSSSGSTTEVRPTEAAAAAEHGTATFNRVTPPYAVHRYIVGSGNLHGGMVLELHAAAQLAAEGDAGVCIFQIVPWHVRLWLHTLQLTIDGRVSPLSQHLLLRHVSTAQDRARPLVLNLCLRLPANARSISLSAQFTKAFLTAFEHPPDAHRGFDVPAAQITYLGVLQGQNGTDVGFAETSLEGCGAGWCVHRFRAQDAGNDAEVLEDDVANTSLMRMLAELRPQQVYSPGLLVPLAVPDFSMPYNVICLTSTVLAVFFGATLNKLLARPGAEQRLSAAGGEASIVAKRRKKLKLLVVVVILGGLTVYVDPSVQEAVIDQLKAFGLISQ